MEEIHPTALIHPNATLKDHVEVSPYAIIEENVVIGDYTHIGPHARLASGTRIGKNCKVHQGAVLGTIPQDLKFSNEETILEIGDNTVIREYCTLNRGTKDRWKTTIGKNCLLMAYVHIAHDCDIGNHVVIANAVNMAGHITIEDYASIGGMTPIHQFCRIGQHAFVGGGYRVVKDIPPYILVAGEPLQFGGVNSIGLRRHGFDNDVIHLVKNVYKIIYKSDLNVSQALTRVKESFSVDKEVKNIVEFIESSERGIVK